ncbi:MULTISPECIES: hypothetical protein [unclassified Moorena]|uniref:hypothetical protein n=1 Tax=unclassified Moorena TaxID=2683338 RepID=UPI001400BBBD|nr:MULTISPECIES: hypothetical protein [unclassified Moorena]NEO13249.1 hypothetical protein [Moorena sp. SIO3E8]NEP98589.1 hypothetical protein [Moorena sp. SIO3F7]
MKKLDKKSIYLYKKKVRWGTPKPRSKTNYACGEETSILPGSGLVKQVTSLKQESPSFQGGECQESLLEFPGYFQQEFRPTPPSVSLFPIPYSLFPIPYSLFPIPYSLFPIPFTHYQLHQF